MLKATAPRSCSRRDETTHIIGVGQVRYAGGGFAPPISFAKRVALPRSGKCRRGEKVCLESVVYLGGTEGSKPLSSSGESTANLAAPRGSNDHVTQIDPDAEPDPAFRYETTQNPPTWAVGVVLGDGRKAKEVVPAGE